MKMRGLLKSLLIIPMLIANLGLAWSGTASTILPGSITNLVLPSTRWNLLRSSGPLFENAPTGRQTSVPVSLNKEYAAQSNCIWILGGQISSASPANASIVLIISNNDFSTTAQWTNGLTEVISQCPHWSNRTPCDYAERIRLYTEYGSGTNVSSSSLCRRHC